MLLDQPPGGRSSRSSRSPRRRPVRRRRGDRRAGALGALGADDRGRVGALPRLGRRALRDAVDHVDVAGGARARAAAIRASTSSRCSCMWVRGHVPAAAAPPAAASWADGRARRGERAAGEPVAPAARRRGADRAAADEPDRRGPGPTSLDRRATSGSNGCSAASSSSTAGSTIGCAPVWPTRRSPGTPRGTTLAARLVDARAGALANRVRRLAGVVGTRPTGTSTCSPRSGILHLLAQAGQRVPDLPRELADAVAVACGWQVRQADVLAGVPDTDTWVVAGRSDTREDRIEVRRVWLRGVERRGVGDGAVVRRLPPGARHSLAVGDALRCRRPPLPRGRRGGRSSGLATSVAGAEAAVRRRRRTVAEAHCAEVGTGAGRRAVARPGPGDGPGRRRRSAGGRWVLTDDTG